MTEEEKINRFLDAQEYPEKYSEDELQKILQEGEDLAKLKSALMEERASNADLDIDAEWKKFSEKHLNTEARTIADGHKDRTLHNYRKLRIAAMFIGFVFIAGVALAAMTSLGIISNPFTMQGRSLWTSAVEKTDVKVVRTTTRVAPANRVDNDSTKTKPVTKVFDNATLAEIMQEIGKYYNVEVIFANNDAKAIRLYFEWNQVKSLDENITILNSFNQIAITRQDNTITIE